MKLPRQLVIPVALVACACAPPTGSTTPVTFGFVSPSPTPLAGRSPAPASGNMRLAIQGSEAPGVGTTVTLSAVRYYDGGTPYAGAGWGLDAGDEARATLAPSADGASCAVTFQAPGTVRVHAIKDGLVAYATLVGVASPAPARLLALPSPAPDGVPYTGLLYADTPVIVRNADEWTRYWQGIFALNVQQGRNGRFAVPPLPAVDLATHSLVVVGSTFGDVHEAPVIADVGPNRVLAGLPEVPTGVGLATEVSYFQLYEVPKLSDTATVVYECRSTNCQGLPAALPSPDPFHGLGGEVLYVGQAVDLPAQNEGVPLTWSLGARTADRATLSGTRLTPKAPGGLVLNVSDGVHAGVVFEAIAADPTLDTPLYASMPGNIGVPEGQPRLFTSATDWSTFWRTSWYAPGTGADQPWTAPPPPPDAPSVDFTRHALLLANVNSDARPVVTAIDGHTVHLVAPASQLPPAPASAAPSPEPGQPTASGQPPSHQYLFQLPPLTGPVTLQLETFADDR